MAVNTYDDFQKKLKEYGYAMSDADMQLAKMNPDAGMSILNYKRDYYNASTDDERALANKGAENIRSTYGNYTGGSDGSKFYVDTPTPMSYYKEDYQNPYQSQYDQALNAVMNQKGWSYNPENDQAYQAAKKQYMREADRATQNTMGQAAAMTGGIPSTAAVNAASQAGDYYRTQLSDQLGNYMDKSYQRYIDAIGNDYDRLSALRSMSNDARDQYDTDRNFGYNQWTDDLGYRTDREQTEYERKQDEYNKQMAEKQYKDALMLDMIDSYMQQYDKTGERSYRKQAEALLNEVAKQYYSFPEEETKTVSSSGSGGSSGGSAKKSSGGGSSGGSAKKSSGGGSSGGSSGGGSDATGTDNGNKTIKKILEEAAKKAAEKVKK